MAPASCMSRRNPSSAARWRWCGTAIASRSMWPRAPSISMCRRRNWPGMPEWGMLPIPTKLVKQGVRDMVRLSDARMSGTSYGACILHVAPESFVGGPLALVRNGDRIALDVAARTINLDVSEAELARRRSAWKQPARRFERGYGWMFSKHIRQANEGCDFDFLETGFGKPVDEPAIY